MGPAGRVPPADQCSRGHERRHDDRGAKPRTNGRSRGSRIRTATDGRTAERWGQPVHAADSETLIGKLISRDAHVCEARNLQRTMNPRIKYEAEPDVVQAQ